MKSLFSNPTIIKQWEWDGDLECQPVLPIVQEDDQNVIKIKIDSESILLRSLNLRKNKSHVTQVKPQKRPEKKVVTEHTTFLPAPIHKMTQQELKKSLKSIGLSTTGTRAEMMQRLEKFVSGEKK